MSVQAKSAKQQEADARYRAALAEAQALAVQSIEHGNHTIANLIEQEEKMNDVEDILEDNQSIITESLKRLRNMTWAGYLYNTVTSLAPASSAPAPAATADAVTSSKQPSSSSRSNRDDLFAQASEAAPQSEEDRMLEDISRSIAALHSVTVTVGESLEASSKQVDRIDLATDRLHDETLYAALRAAKLTSSKASSSQITPCGVYQFVLPDASALLSVREDRLVLTPSADRSCLFSCFLKNGVLVGLRAESTLKYVGCTMWGGVAVSGDYLGAQEELFVALTGQPSGLLFLARNFGGGGWLRADGAGSTPEGALVLGATTSSAADKTNMLLLQAVRCGDTLS